MSNPGGIIIEQDKAAKERRGKFSHLPKFSHDKTPKQEDQGKANPGVKKIKFPHMHLVMAADTQAEKSLSVQGGATKEAQKEGEKEADKEAERDKYYKGVKSAIKKIFKSANYFQSAGGASTVIGAAAAVESSSGALPQAAGILGLGLAAAGVLGLVYGAGKRHSAHEIDDACGLYQDVAEAAKADGGVYGILGITTATIVPYLSALVMGISWALPLSTILPVVAVEVAAGILLSTFGLGKRRAAEYFIMHTGCE